MSDNPVWADEIAARQDRGEDLEFTPDAFAKVVGVSWPDPQLQEYFDRLAGAGELTLSEGRRCPSVSCGRPLDAGMVASGECPHCGYDFEGAGEEPIRSPSYSIIGEPSRDIRWMIVVHGMNTRAPWQEDLSWLIANKLRYSAPVLIHKYGWATIDVLVPWLQRRLAKSLGHHIQRASAYASECGLTAAPDILVHSFGSRLFAMVLDDPEFSELRFGRVITAGSIIRPDFEWSQFLAAGRVEAVLNHIGDRDKPVLCAQFLIPGTGPSGRFGFVDPAVINHEQAGFDHSACLSSEHLRQTLAEGGMWDRYLTQPAGRFTTPTPRVTVSWKPAFAPLRWVGHIIGGLLFVAGLVLLSIQRRLNP